MTAPPPVPEPSAEGGAVRAARAAGSADPIARLVGIDFARFLAILGMMCAHLLPRPGMPGHEVWLDGLVDGNASTLFAVIGGISVVLATRRYLEVGAYAAAAWALAARGVLVILLGATLAMAPISVVIVLVYFGVAMLGTIPFLRMPVRWLLGSAALLAVLGQLVNAPLRAALDVGDEGGGLAWTEFADPLRALRGALVTGTYPVITWLVYLLVGMAVARLLLAVRHDDRAARRFLLGAGLLGLGLAVLSIVSSRLIFELWGRAAAVQAAPGLDAALIDELARLQGQGAPAAADWWWLLGAAPHTGTLLDILRGVGVALFVIALMLGFARWAPRWLLVALRPVSAAGAAPLTVYTVHVLGVILATSLVLLLGPPAFSSVPWWYLSAQILGVHLAVALVIGAVLAVLGRRGPLEALVSAVSTAAARLGSGSARRGTPPARNAQSAL
ncbi:heparan-alpha-glucosaminide N-acetyltransferase domain-containing protein [Microterricola pindariensis]|uniref:heparan-alpha-glucosaminide N-acetyltransferase domain-containing protein n=1 Tax=Microterricola pindariensis TaxID=478010 RepID=UPI000CEC905F|nr:heparan-alpha-glucosaminide N-acetyltransferase domain-containing protein [Microterricola pindariensis]